MINFVKTTQLISQNGQDCTTLDFNLGTVTGLTRDINCPDTTIIGAFWRIPIVQGATVTKYEYVQAVDSTAPTPDSLKILRVKFKHDTYEMAIATTDYITIVDAFATLCDGLGGSLATMPIVTIPFPIFQNGPTSVDSTTGTKIFTFPFPLNPLGLLYSIPNPVFNGVAPSLAYAPAGITTAAGFVTWANTNWSTYGTFSSSGDIVRLSNPTSAGTVLTKAGLSVSLTAALWCLDITSFSTPQVITGMQLGTAPIIQLPAFTATDVNYQTIINAIKPHFEAGAIFTQTVAHKITISTTSAVLRLIDGVTTEATATAGTC